MPRATIRRALAVRGAGSSVAKLGRVDTLRSLVTLMALVALPSTTGCSVLGLGIGTAIGAASPRYDEISPYNPALPVGANVRVRTSEGRFVADVVYEGAYTGTRDDALIVSSDEGDDAIKLASIRELHVKNGTYWRRGMNAGLIVGGTIDVIIVIVGLATFRLSR